jgi:Fic family protein
MKLPQTPPFNDAPHKVLAELDQTALLRLFQADVGPCDAKGRYLHWDKLRHLPTPEGLTPDLHWVATKLAREKIARGLPLISKDGRPFRFCIPDILMRDLLWLSENASGAIEADSVVRDKSTREHYLFNSLIEESINSSQLEGASTTRRVAKDMLTSGRKPTDHSEKMIVNNFQAMRFIREHKDDPLTPSIIFELHQILTENTLEQGDEHLAGRFRRAEDDICVFSKDDQLLHIPPKAVELPQRLQAICDFANAPSDTGGVFIPPVLKAIIVHFMIGYDHPFVDGNGRTARALFYWIMAKEGYWLLEYTSISRVIKKAPGMYQKAYLYTETDANDVTYFIVHQLQVIRESIRDLHEWLTQKMSALRQTADALEGSHLQNELNHRQLAVIKHALKNPGFEYSIKGHQSSHGVVYQTARTDLISLADNYGLLKRYKRGRKDVFVVPSDLTSLISKAKP